MSEEEKEAIYEIEDIRFDERTNRKIEIILNLIEKLQKENEELKNYEYIKALLQQADDLKGRIKELEEEKERAVGLYAQASLNVKSLNGMVNELDNKVKLKDKAIEELQKENAELKEKIKEYEIGKEQE